MESVPPLTYQELATKQDLALLRDELRVDVRELRAETRELRADLKADMAQQLRVTVLTHVGSMVGLAAFLSAFG